AVARVDDEGKRRDRLLLALVLAAALLVGHPETLLHVLLLAAAFALARLLARPRGSRSNLAAAWALSTAVALGLAAPALLPALSYLPQGMRTEALEARSGRLRTADPPPGGP